MNDTTFSQTDLEEIDAHGLSLKTVTDQLRMFAKGVRIPELIAPCTINNGVTMLAPDSIKRLAAVFRQAADRGRITKFVPASGAATRMFKELIAACQVPGKKGTAADRCVSDLIDNIDRFACREDLISAIKLDGLKHEELIAEGRHETVLEYLLTPKGLGYANLPKGLIPFHRYMDVETGETYSRTPFEEHLAEAAELFAGRDNRCRVHFTVPLAHESAIEEHIRAAAEHITKKYGVMTKVTFSTQNPATDTIAVTHDNALFRDQNNRLVFRPGGHGALLDNLDSLQGDIVFIKNIDNIATETVRQKTSPAIAAMCGLLVQLQQQIFAFLERLSSEKPGKKLIAEIAAWASRHLNLKLDDIITGSDLDEAGKKIAMRLNRPLRVCGVVKNVGEPGGGPFWIRDSRGEVSVQIIEATQVDMSVPRQKEIWLSSTHFNPVMIACAVRDYKGRPFALADYSDPLAGIITEKSKDGRSLKALEHPGLWNGAMAFWNTVFVELPSEAFNPVKTLFDLLREGHSHAPAMSASTPRKW